MYSSNNSLILTKRIIINTKYLVVNYVKQNSYFNKIIGYNNIK
jgi:hypothetical protein